MKRFEKNFPRKERHPRSVTRKEGASLQASVKIYHKTHTSFTLRVTSPHAALLVLHLSILSSDFRRAIDPIELERRATGWLTKRQRPASSRALENGRTAHGYGISHMMQPPRKTHQVQPFATESPRGFLTLSLPPSRPPSLSGVSREQNAHRHQTNNPVHEVAGPSVLAAATATGVCST